MIIIAMKRIIKHRTQCFYFIAERFLKSRKIIKKCPSNTSPWLFVLMKLKRPGSFESGPDIN